MKKYFEKPTQVFFIEHDEFDAYAGSPDEITFLAGIGVEDYVICGCCGSRIYTDEIYDLIELPWIDINEAISGIENDELADEVTKKMDEIIARGVKEYAEDEEDK